MKHWLTLFALLVTFSCGKDYDKISTTRVKPPVQEALPASLLAGGTFGLTTLETDYSKTCQTDPTLGDACQDYEGIKQIQCIVKNRLFCKGPTEVLNLLSSLDGRLEEIESRSSNGEVACIKGAAVDLSSELIFPGDRTLTGKFKCQDSSIGFGFGDDAGTWYIREAGGAAGQMFSISPENLVDGYIWLPSSDGTFAESTGLLRIQADRTGGTVEITGGGVGLGFCSFHFKSNATHVYIYANPEGVGGSCDYDQSGTSDGDDWVEACLNAGTLDNAAGECTSIAASLALTTIGRDATTATGGRVTSWDAATEPGNGSAIERFEMYTYLKTLFDSAKVFTGVSEFKTEE